MPTLSQLQAQREAILRQMSAPSEVVYNDRRMTNRPQIDLEAALCRIDVEIAGLQKPQSRQFTVTTSRGIES